MQLELTTFHNQAKELGFVIAEDFPGKMFELQYPLDRAELDNTTGTFRRLCELCLNTNCVGSCPHAVQVLTHQHRWVALCSRYMVYETTEADIN